MPAITALLHTANDALRLGRTLEMLLPCAQFLIVDHHSTDPTRRIAREYGALIVSADGEAGADHYLQLAPNDWILCMHPGESISESLQASLFDWRSSARAPDGVAYSVLVREQSANQSWRQWPAPETRLIPRHWALWNGWLPARAPAAIALEGEILRFALP